MSRIITTSILMCSLVVPGWSQHRLEADGVALVGRLASAAAGTPEVLSAQFAMAGAELPLCEGKNDLLPVTFSFPFAGEPHKENFTVIIGEGEGAVNVTPTCATLKPADEANERQTVLLLGQFQQSGAMQPMSLRIEGTAFTVNGSTVPYGDSASSGTVVSLVRVTTNQGLVAFDVLDLDATNNTAAVDVNGCAALHTSATYAVRLIFSSGVRERDAADRLVSLGTTDTPARARALFQLLTPMGGPSSDTIVGLADSDGDNVVDICVQGATAQRDATVVLVRCTADGAVLDPSGIPCETPIEVHLDINESDGITAVTNPSSESAAGAPSAVESDSPTAAANAVPTKHSLLLLCFAASVAEFLAGIVL